MNLEEDLQQIIDNLRSSLKAAEQLMVKVRRQERECNTPQQPCEEHSWDREFSTSEYVVLRCRKCPARQTVEKL